MYDSLPRSTMEQLAARMEARNADVIIAVDPDIDRNGVAVLSRKTKRVNVFSLRFAETIERLQKLHDAANERNERIVILIEGGWLNPSNWHFRYTDSKAKCAAMGRHVGMNHECGILLTEMCGHYNLPYRIIKPLEKRWQGRDGKITQDEITQFIPDLPKRMNQDERDATLIAWVFAGFPIRINPLRKS